MKLKINFSINKRNRMENFIEKPHENIQNVVKTEGH